MSLATEIAADIATDRPTGPLAGIVITDLSRILAGPYCAMLLADMGATVIKVESSDGDDTRAFAPPVHEGVATYYQAANRNKRSITLDFTDEDDLAVVRDLIASSDIVIENFKANGLKQFGLDYETVSANKPELIYGSITGFGTGEGAKYAGYDLMIQALSGFMDTTGPQDGDAYRGGFALFDVLTGLHMSTGLLAALRHRDQTGQGQLVETNLMTAALSSMANQSQAYVAGGVVQRRMGNQHPSLYPYEPFHAADVAIVIAVGNNAQFARMSDVIARPHLATDARFATPPLRNANRAALRPLINDALSGRTAAEWFEIFTNAGVPAAPIQTIQGGIEFADSIGLDPIVEVEGLPMIRNPLTFSETPVNYRLAPPTLGEHSELIRAQLNTKDHS